MNIKFIMVDQLKNMLKADSSLTFGEVLYTAFRPKNSKIKSKNVAEISIKDIREMKDEHIYTSFENALTELNNK